VTTDARAPLAFALLALLALGCADMNEARRGDSVDVSKYPPDIQQAYEVFANRCGRCHTLARPLNARISDPQHWVRYVARMRRQPGSGIDHSNADVIVKFLLFYHRVRGAESEPGTPAEQAPSEPSPPAPSPASPPPSKPEPPAQPEQAPLAPPVLPPPSSTDFDDITGTPDGVPHGENP
jgi:hypothetical protein